MYSKFLIIFAFLLDNHFLFAQNENEVITVTKEQTAAIKPDNKLLLDEELNSINIDEVELKLLESTKKSTKLFNSKPLKDDKYLLKKTVQLSVFSIAQNKIESQSIGLGNYSLFNNNFIYNYNNRLSLRFGLGLLKQSSVINYLNPSIHYNLNSYLEYKFTDHLSLYMYGQYLGADLNNSANHFDPLIYNNPLFIHTEVGAGLKAEYKFLKLDVGMKALQENMFDKKSLNLMKAKFTFDF